MMYCKKTYVILYKGIVDKESKEIFAIARYGFIINIPIKAKIMIGIIKAIIVLNTLVLKSKCIKIIIKV